MADFRSPMERLMGAATHRLIAAVSPGGSHEGLLTQAPRTAPGSRALLGSEPSGMPWIFQDMNDGRPFRDPEGSGTAAVVVSVRDEWATNAHNTAKFPTLKFLIYSDLSRENKAPKVRDGLTRALSVAHAIVEIFHDPAKQHQFWIDPDMDSDTADTALLHVMDCIKAGRIGTSEIPNSDGMYRADVSFEVSL